MGKFWQRYKVLIIFCVITVLGWIFSILPINNGIFWKIWGVLDVSFSVSLGILAFLAYKELITQEDEIPIYIKIKDTDKEPYNTHLALLRKNITRSEILGVLGMIQKDTVTRYGINYTKERAFLEQLHKVQKGNKKEFIIMMTQVEFEQFDIK